MSLSRTEREAGFKVSIDAPPQRALAPGFPLRGLSPWLTLSQHPDWDSVGTSSRVSSTPSRTPDPAARVVRATVDLFGAGRCPFSLPGCFKAGLDRHQVMLALSLISFCTCYHFQTSFTRSLPSRKLLRVFSLK